ncbi:brain protein I3 [Diaphorina citri]|uniref:Membrane protein BRI3 n=1 Tax=Diaphorina citri TaxID=121845 RepID=A0A3Q0JD13_DIACI|nr:brain protein I3 [Diaphorina citri]
METRLLEEEDKKSETLIRVLKKITYHTNFIIRIHKIIILLITGYGSLPPPPKYDATQAINTQPGYYGATYQFPVQQEIIIVGGCPICRIGKVEEYYSCLGLFCAVFCFPFGLIPCLLLKDKICTNCGTHLN